MKFYEFEDWSTNPSEFYYIINGQFLSIHLMESKICLSSEFPRSFSPINYSKWSNYLRYTLTYCKLTNITT
jgi:hypothetical protein